MSGWIADHRKELESNIWLMPPMYHRVWQWIKYSVNHKEVKIPRRSGGFTTIKPGQRATSYRQIAKGVGYYDGLKWKEPNPKTIKSILDFMVNDGMILVEGNSDGTVITIANWEVYQENNVKGNTKETLGKHSMDTNNNDLTMNNNENNIKDKVLIVEDSKESPTFKFADDFNSAQFRCVKYLITAMQKNNPSVKVPKPETKSFDTWCDSIDKLNRIDNISWEQIKQLIDFSQNDNFWKSNILSASKLREKKDTLILQSKRTEKNDPFTKQIEDMKGWDIK